MTFFTVLLIVIVILAVIGLGPIQVYGQETQLTGSAKWESEIDKCMVSLKAQNPRPAHLQECDAFMPMVQQMIESNMIYDKNDVKQKVDEYLTQRSLDAFTEEEMKQKSKESGIVIK